VSVDPSQCALLVMDFQPVVLSSMDDADELIKNANDAIGRVRRFGGHVAFVRVALEDLDYSTVPATNKAFSAVAAARRLGAASPETAIHPDIDVEDGDIVARKTRVGALSTTDLDEQLTNLGVTTLIVAGVHTSGVVLSTVRHAADLDYRLILLSDCISDPDTEIHRALMERIFPRQAEVITVAGLGGLLSG
jgi:nicotinamidase-related amidase